MPNWLGKLLMLCAHTFRLKKAEKILITLVILKSGLVGFRKSRNTCVGIYD